MKYVIKEIKKRSFIERFLSHKEWRVTVEREDGRCFAFNAWGNVSTPSLASLTWSIKNHLILLEPDEEAHFKRELVGMEIAV